MSGSESDNAIERWEEAMNAYKFNEAEYWEHFNSEPNAELDVFDWYSSEELLVDAIHAHISTNSLPADSPILDIGVGTCPILFTLASKGYTNLTGIDFSQKAIEFMQTEGESIAATLDPAPTFVFRVADAKDMSALPQHNYAVIFDKGCLDCFVNGGGHADVATYLRGVRELLAPGGVFMVVSVCSADIVRVVTRGEIVRDQNAAASAHSRTKVTSFENEEAVPLDEPVLK